MGSERSVYVSKETETMNSFEAHKDAVREQAGQCGPAHTRVELISDAPGERKPEEKEIDAAARPDPVEPPIVAAAPGSAGLVEPVTSFDEAFGEASSGIATDDTNAPAEPGGRSAASGTDDVAIDAAAKPPEENGAAVTDKVFGRTTPGTDVADPDEAVVGSDDSDAASEAEGWLEDDRPTVADSSAGTTYETSDAETAPQNFKQKLLDESTGDLVALEDFDREVDDRAFESEWLGAHNDISRQAIREELLRTGRYTAHIDEADDLLSDREEWTLAVELEVQITYCVHRGWTKDQKREFILRSQTGKRVLSYEEQRELKNRLIVVRLRLGMDYKTIGKMFGVHPNTARNVEKRAAADPNSKVGITQPPDRRYAPETREKIAKAAELRKDGMAEADIATMLETDLTTIRTWDRPARDKAKGKKAGQANSRMQPAGTIDDLADSDGVPERHHRALKHLVLNASAYAEWLKEADEKAQQDSNAAAGDLEASVKAELYFTQRAEVEKSRQRQILSSTAEAAVEEAPGDSPSDGTGPTQAGDILLGVVKSIKPDEVSVALSVGRGVIDTRDEYLAIYVKLQEKEAFRFRVEGFDRKREIWKVKLLGQQTVAPAPGATAARSDSDDRSSPYADLAGRKAGPKETGVTK